MQHAEMRQNQNLFRIQVKKVVFRTDQHFILYWKRKHHALSSCTILFHIKEGSKKQKKILLLLLNKSNNKERQNILKMK